MVTKYNDPRQFHKLEIKKFSQIYKDKNLRDTGGFLANYFMRRSHSFLEKTLPQKYSMPSILELGASDSRHMDVVKKFSKYVLSDKSINILSETFDELPDNVELVSVDASKPKDVFCNQKFDRIIACNLLEHLNSPEEILFDWYDLLHKGGTISLLQPCDPGMLWRLGRKFGPRKGLSDKGMNYDLLMALEHVNAISNIITISKESFNSKILYFPFRIPSWNFNLFSAIHIVK